MPLSEHEQRLLEQMERALYQDDPKFATAMRGARGGTRQRYLIGAVGLVVGLVVLLVGVVNSSVWAGGLGFAIMLGAATYALAPPRRRRPGPVGVVGGQSRPAARRPTRKASRSGTFMQRLEARWDRRRNGWE